MAPRDEAPADVDTARGAAMGTGEQTGRTAATTGAGDGDAGARAAACVARAAAAERDAARLLRAPGQEELGRRLAAFAELVEASGPLAYLRFDARRFALAVAPQLQPTLAALAAADGATVPSEARAAVGEQLCDRCIAAVTDAEFIGYLRAELGRFAALPFVPDADVLAVGVARALVPRSLPGSGLQAAEVPALRAIFAAQIDGLLSASQAADDGAPA